jgi:hypothetical protein
VAGDSSAQIVARSSAFCPYPASAQLERESAAPTRARLRVGSLASFPSFPLGLLEARTLRAFYSNNSVRCCFLGTRRPCWVSACRAVWCDRFRVSAKTELPAALLLRTATVAIVAARNGLAFVPRPANKRLVPGAPARVQVSAQTRGNHLHSSEHGADLGITNLAQRT